MQAPTQGTSRNSVTFWPTRPEWQYITGESHLLSVQGAVDRCHRLRPLGDDLSAQSDQSIHIDIVCLKPLYSASELLHLLWRNVHACRL